LHKTTNPPKKQFQFSLGSTKKKYPKRKLGYFSWLKLRPDENWMRERSESPVWQSGAIDP
jgi:hypothetical protein